MGTIGWLTQRTPILATGSVALAEDKRPRELPNQYQIVRIERGRFTRYCRGYSLRQKGFIGDTQAILGGNDWKRPEDVDFEGISAAFPASYFTKSHNDEDIENIFPYQEDERRFKRRFSPDFSGALYNTGQDDFLNRLSTVCKLREKPGADICLIPGEKICYLRVCTSERGIVNIFPVGGTDRIDTPGIQDVFRTFIDKVVKKYKSSNPGVISSFVYCGNTLPQDSGIYKMASANGIRLYSFVEYQGLIDFSGYIERQTSRLQNDTIYRPDLYIPQKIQFEIGMERDIRNDARETLCGWLKEQKGRFILLLGDFGTGKTFLLHEVARCFGEENGPFVPLLIEMRYLEKGRSLDELVAQHLTREGMDFEKEPFHYMLNQGQIVLLFDGFDELALRVTYDRVTEHLNTLIEAATGEYAKIVLTSRTQHFKSDKHARSSFLSEKVENLTKHRIAWLKKFEKEQILRFLVKRHGSRTKAEKYLELLGDIKDLAGLSATPRMLDFIVKIPEEELQSAKEGKKEITPAVIYQKILAQWLEGEQKRAEPRGAPPQLQIEHRWKAVTLLAVALWKRIEPALSLNELAEEVRDILTSLSEGMDDTQPLDTDVATHQVGSGTLLVRDEDGRFVFIHQSVMEWLVAKEASEELKGTGGTKALSIKDISELMADFIIAMAGREKLKEWADDVIASKADGYSKRNALLILDRMKEEAGKGIDMAGQSLKGKDLSGRDLTGASLKGADLTGARLIKAILRRANLSDAKLIKSDLSGADLRGTDLTNADFSGANLCGANLSGARIDKTLFQRAKLIGAHYPEIISQKPEYAWGAALSDKENLMPLSSMAVNDTAIAFSPDGNLIASHDNTLRVWERASGRCLVILAHLPEGWAAYTPEGRYKYGGNISGEFWHTISLCRFEPGELDPYWPVPLRMPDNEYFIP